MLTNPPEDARDRELWLQHAAGLILFQDVRRYAQDRIDPALDEAARAAALKAVDDALYGVMMVADGVSGILFGQEYQVNLRIHVCLSREEEVVQDLDLFSGDGMCMGFHGWMEGDFGRTPLLEEEAE